MRPGRLYHINIFLTVIEAGGISRAARRLGISASTVSRAISILEEQLAVRLFDRSTRRVTLTRAAERYAEDCVRVRDALRYAEEVARGRGARASGCLTFAMSSALGSHLVSPLLTEYLELHPDVSVLGTVIDRPFNCDEEGIDVALQLGTPSAGATCTMILGQTHRRICASPEYLARSGVPRAVEDLISHTIIRTTSAFRMRRWWEASSAPPSGQAREPRITLDGSSAITAACLGLGILETFWHDIADLVAADKLRVVLPHLFSAPIPVFLVHRSGALRVAHVRAFIELARTRMLSDLFLEMPRLNL